MIKTIFLALALSSLTACSYMGMLASQTNYAWRQQTSPEQRLYKHMLSHETFLVLGKIGGGPKANRDATAVIAISDKFMSSEVVDVNHSARPDAYYSLNLPAGDYRLLVVSDLNRDGYYDETEVIGARTASLTKEAAPDKVLSQCDIHQNMQADQSVSFRINARKTDAARQSLFYPDGSIRPLEDPLFSPRMATLGMYEPAAFLEAAPTMFYALEEDHFYKVPVVFVHGIEGSARAFNKIVAALDRTRYKPLFFYYPSGADLDQLSAIFYNIFISGKFFATKETTMVIVAHSMGGLVVREALNLRTGAADENRMRKLITVGSPMGGIAAARMSERAPVTLPAWRDLIPESGFIKGLHRKPLPEDMQYHLIFTYGDARRIKWGSNSDGVVSLISQLDPRTQKEATVQLGFNDSHMGILENSQAISEIMRIIGETPSPYPKPYMRELARGGYQVSLGPHYTPLEKFYIHNFGHFFHALASGRLPPLQPAQRHFVSALRGEILPNGEMESGWIKFSREHPGPRDAVQYAGAADALTP